MQYVLENKILSDGFVESGAMNLASVIVMGLKDEVTKVLSRNDAVPFSQDPVTKAVSISFCFTTKYLIKEYSLVIRI